MIWSDPNNRTTAGATQPRPTPFYKVCEVAENLPRHAGVAKVMDVIIG
jgi:hypothetical protein